MKRIYNFSAGPSCLPEEALKKAASEMLDFSNTGMSVMEISHRSAPFEQVIEGCESLLRDLMNIPENYKVLFLQGGASSQFSMVPLNLMNKNKKADFVVTGNFAKKAYEEAARYGNANVVATSADKNFSYIPKLDPATFSKDADYFNICMNNTIFGTHFPEIPDTGSVPLVADVSSCILSKPYDVSRFGLLYAGAQKNMGPSGLTVVIVRDDLIGNEMDITPTMMKYSVHAKNGSMYNTPPTYSIYMCKLVLEWVREMGGTEAMEKRNREKADLLYSYLDSSKLFRPTITAKEDRSIMNVTCVTGNSDLDKLFCAQAAENGLVGLKGHRLVGGIRASIYNAMPLAGVEALVNFMQDFEKANI